MSKHPLNLALRFLLEMAGLAALAYWGWAWGDPWRWPLAIGLPLVAAVIWATFRTPGDQTANQKTPVPVHGIIRLSIEMTFFGLAIVALFTAQSSNERAELAGIILTLLVIAHYILSWDRVTLLLLTFTSRQEVEDDFPDFVS